MMRAVALRSSAPRCALLRRQKRTVQQRRSLCLRASSSPDPDAGPASAMSLEEAEQTLQVKRGADFDTVLRAKNKQIAKSGDDDEKKFMVRVQLFCASQ